MPQIPGLSRFTIVGAGAMGCLFAARLAEAGAAVTLVDVDAKRLALLARDGITLHDDHAERTVRIGTALAGDAVGPADVIMLFTKGMHSRDAIASVAHLAGQRPLAVTLQNGLGNAELLAGTFGNDRVIMGVTDFPSDLQGPTTVSSHGQGHIAIGGFAAGLADECTALAERFNTSGLATHVAQDIRVAVWEKVAFNAALNSIATVTGMTNGGMDRAGGKDLICAIANEVVDTAQKLGIAADRDRVHSRLDFALSNHRDHKPSMLQDRLAGRRTEIESINGAVVRIAREAGLAVPHTAALAHLVRMIEMGA